MRERILRSIAFTATAAKLQSARARLDEMKASLAAADRLRFRRAYESCVLDLRQIYFALRKEGVHCEGFAQWFDSRSQSLKGDPLWKFLVAERNQIEKEGVNSLRYTTEIRGAYAPCDPPTPDANFSVRDNTMWWIVDLGGPNEKWYPALPKGPCDYVETIYLEKAPEMHLGEKLAASDPVSVCELGILTMQDLVQEARVRFSET